MGKSRTQQYIEQLASQRILVLDGAMGTEIHKHGLAEQDYQGTQFADHTEKLWGNNDLLVITRPDIVQKVHEDYLAAGADIIETNTFSATSVVQQRYGLDAYAYDINFAAAKVARSAADKWTKRTPEKPRFVAGAFGPLKRSPSMSPELSDPSHRDPTYDRAVTAYKEQALGLIDGGVDILLVETVSDTLDCKAALFAIAEAFEERKLPLEDQQPIMVSVTVVDAGGRNLSGQTVSAFWHSIVHCRPMSVGVNCALGAKEMRPHIAELSAITDALLSAYPNAGSPNRLGAHDETPEQTGGFLRELAEAGLVNFVGGCCGTSPAHIAAIATQVEGVSPRAIPTLAAQPTRLSGLEPYSVLSGETFAVIGERANVTSNSRFASLVRDGNWADAVAVASAQVASGANIIDVNMDDSAIDGVSAMTTFLEMIAVEPQVARVPIMIDSSQWEVIEAGLKRVQGKPIVHCISLEDGEAEFLAKARSCQKYGAAAVVLALDERGRPGTSDRKFEICKRAYELLTQKLNFDPTDIIFDPSVSAADPETVQAGSAIAFLGAVELIKKHLPGAKVSGRVSDLGLSVRGSDWLREVFHSAFLHHAIKAGMDMGISNPRLLGVFDEIPMELLEHLEDVLFNRRSDATARMVAFAETLRGRKETADVEPGET